MPAGGESVLVEAVHRGLSSLSCLKSRSSLCNPSPCPPTLGWFQLQFRLPLPRKNGLIQATCSPCLVSLQPSPAGHKGLSPHQSLSSSTQEALVSTMCTEEELAPQVT